MAVAVAAGGVVVDVVVVVDAGTEEFAWGVVVEAAWVVEVAEVVVVLLEAAAVVVVVVVEVEVGRWVWDINGMVVTIGSWCKMVIRVVPVGEVWRLRNEGRVEALAVVEEEFVVEGVVVEGWVEVVEFVFVFVVAEEEVEVVDLVDEPLNKALSRDKGLSPIEVIMGIVRWVRVWDDCLWEVEVWDEGGGGGVGVVVVVVEGAEGGVVDVVDDVVVLVVEEGFVLVVGVVADLKRDGIRVEVKRGARISFKRAASWVVKSPFNEEKILLVKDEEDIGVVVVGWVDGDGDGDEGDGWVWAVVVVVGVEGWGLNRLLK